MRTGIYTIRQCRDRQGTAKVAAGSVWLWAREEMAKSVDVLFVDEAGQMSLANVLAASPSATSIVLLGDPQQLDQPQKGVHPPGADVSGLLVVVPTGLLNFIKDSSDLPDAGNDFLLQFTPRLAATACNDTYKKEISSIVVEGHTDTDGTDEINLPLSQRRALSVVQKTHFKMQRFVSSFRVNTGSLVL